MLISVFTPLVAILLGLIVLALFGYGLIQGIERYRRWRSDQRGFTDFLAAGAPLKHTRLLDAFTSPASFVDDRQTASVVAMGELAVPDGRIIVEDPSLAGQAGESPAEFDTLFPCGRFPVEALVLTARQDQRLAAVRVRFANETAVSLEPAFTEEWRVVQARTRRELPWFGIDSATAALGTPKSFGWLLERTAEDDEAGGEFVPGPADGANPYLSGDPRDLFRETGSPDANLFIVYSGYGDGVGSAYIQRDRLQRPVSLIVDFGMVGKPVWDWSPAAEHAG